RALRVAVAEGLQSLGGGLQARSALVGIDHSAMDSHCGLENGPIEDLLVQPGDLFGEIAPGLLEPGTGPRAGAEARTGQNPQLRNGVGDTRVANTTQGLVQVVVSVPALE